MKHLSTFKIAFSSYTPIISPVLVFNEKTLDRKIPENLNEQSDESSKIRDIWKKQHQSVINLWINTVLNVGRKVFFGAGHVQSFPLSHTWCNIHLILNLISPVMSAAEVDVE